MGTASMPWGGGPSRANAWPVPGVMWRLVRSGSRVLAT